MIGLLWVLMIACLGGSGLGQVVAWWLRLVGCTYLLLFILRVCVCCFDLKVLFWWWVGLHFCALLFWCLLIRIGCLIYACCGVVACCVVVGVAVDIVSDIVFVVGFMCIIAGCLDLVQCYLIIGVVVVWVYGGRIV